MQEPITVIGAGSWGTALAILLAKNGRAVNLYGLKEDGILEMQSDRVNNRYLPDCPFPDNITATDSLADALLGIRDVLVVVPSHVFSRVLAQMQAFVDPDIRIAWATKGLDPGSGRLLHEFVEELYTDAVPMAVISGPSFAKEVAIEQPTAVSVASNDQEFAQDICRWMNNNYFRAYPCNDVIGVQLCGAVKNPAAVACGIADGLGLSINSRCALITCALAEMTQLGVAMGGKKSTFSSFAGVGDLVLTCSSEQSRNYRFGKALGLGANVIDAQKEIGQVVEGYSNAFIVRQLAQKYQVNMPIVELLCEVLEGSVNVKDTVSRLMNFAALPQAGLSRSD